MADIYHIWCDLKPGTSDLAFVEHVENYLDSLKAKDQLLGYRITRKKLGLASKDLGEFHLLLEFSNLAQLDAAFDSVSTRNDPIESFHHAVNSLVDRVDFALYRDFPDAHRTTGSERF